MVVAERVGFEPAYKRTFNNMQGDGWHKSTWKAVLDQQTDCKRIADSRGRPPIDRLGVDTRRIEIPRDVTLAAGWGSTRELAAD